MRWITVVAGLTLALAFGAGCKQQCYLTECDYEHYHALGIPDNLECDISAASEPGRITQVGAPATVLHPERKIRYLSLAEAISIALEQGTVNGFQGPQTNTLGGAGPRVNDTLAAFTGNGITTTDAIRVLALDPAITGTAIESALSRFDARFQSGILWQTTEQPNNTPQTAFTASANGRAGISAIVTQQATFTNSIAKPLPTGGVAEITFDVPYQLNNLNSSGVSRFNPSYTPTLTFNFEQPLLQGFGVEINQLRPTHPGTSGFLPGEVPVNTQTLNANEGILITRLRFDQSRAEFERNVHLLVWNVEQAYWVLYGAYWDLYSREAALRQAYEAWKINNARFLAGRVPIADFAQTRGQYEMFRGDRIESMGRLLEAERNLRGFMGLPMEDCTRLVPCDTPTLAPYHPDWCTALNEALTLRPELVLAREELKARQLQLINEKNLLLPDLRFVSSYGIVGTGNRLDGPSPDNALQTLASDHFTNWTAGLQLTVPIGFRDAHAGVRLARLNLARSYLVVRDNEYRTTRFLTQVYRLIFERYAVIEARRAERESYADQLRARFEEFLAGRGTLDILLEAQRFWATALSSEYAAIVDYNNALASFEWAKGTILQHDNIYISEGPLPQCAQIRAVAHQQERTKALVLLERAVPVGYAPCDGKCGPAVPELPEANAVSLPALFEKAPAVPAEADKPLPRPRPVTPGMTPAATPGTTSGNTSTSGAALLPPTSSVPAALPATPGTPGMTAAPAPAARPPAPASPWQSDGGKGTGWQSWPGTKPDAVSGQP
jgi:outer membrane protein TolC